MAVPTSQAGLSRPRPRPPLQRPWTTEEREILHSLVRFCPQGDPRWWNEQFVDNFLMGRLRRTRPMSEVMAWGRGELPDEVDDLDDDETPEWKDEVVEQAVIPDSSQGDQGEEDLFHPANIPSLLSNSSAARNNPKPRSVSSAASSSRILDAALNSLPGDQQRSGAARRSSGRFVSQSGGSVGPSPLGPASTTLLPSNPPRPSGRFVAPTVSLSSWTPSQPSPLASPVSLAPSDPFPSNNTQPIDHGVEYDEAEEYDDELDESHSQLSYALSHPDIPPDVQSQLSFSFSARRSHAGDPIPDPSEPLPSLPEGFTSAHAAILLQRLPSAAECESGSVGERVVYALNILKELGYAADVGSAGNTRPAGGSDRWVFVPRSRPEPGDADYISPPSYQHLEAGPSRTPLAQTTSRTAYRGENPHPSPTTTSSSRGQPSMRGRPTTRSSTAAANSRTRTNSNPSTVSPATSTRSRTAAAVAAASSPFYPSMSNAEHDFSSSPTKSASVRSRSPSESPRPTRRARLTADDTHSIASFSSSKAPSVACSASQVRPLTPSVSPDKTPPSPLPDLPLQQTIEQDGRPDSPPETSEEELPLALRRSVRSSDGGRSSSTRDRTGSNASSFRSSVSSSTGAGPSSGALLTALDLLEDPDRTLTASPAGEPQSSPRPIAGRRRSLRAPVVESSGGGRSSPLQPVSSQAVPSRSTTLTTDEIARRTALSPTVASAMSTLQRRSTTESVRRLAIPPTSTTATSANVHRRSPPASARPTAPANPPTPVQSTSTTSAAHRSWLSFAVPSSLSSLSTRPILPRPTPRSPQRRVSALQPHPASPASTAFSSMSSENDLPVDRFPPPAYEPMREGAVIVQPPERRNQATGRTGTTMPGQGRLEGGIGGRLFGSLGRS